MKNLICINIFIFLSIYIYAQVPQGINYQAIARSSIGDPIKDQPVTVKFRILEGGPNGTQVFTEIHPQILTDGCGMFNLKIGEANPAVFEKIEWSTGSKWLEVTINNSIIGTTELLSVPYALFAGSGVGTPGPPGQSLTISSITNNGDGTYTWHFSDGTIYTTANLIGPPGPTGWTLVGNAGTNPAANFIGTIDDIDLIFKRNNITSGVLDTSNTSYGLNSMSINTPGGENTAIGKQSMYSNLEGHYNTSIGAYSLHSNTTGSYNTASGQNAMFSNTTGEVNTANGQYAMYSNTSGGSNSAIGVAALYSNTTGELNTANGYSALYSNTTAVENSAYGGFALYSNTTGELNTASGTLSLYLNTTGDYNTANGSQALYSNSTGSENTAIGESALYSNTTGERNTANGNLALFLNTNGYNNTANGYYALHSNDHGYSNSANGSNSLYSNINGFENTANGESGLYSNLSGFYNTSNGAFSLYSNSTGSYNTAAGNSSLYSNLGSYNTSIGVSSLYSNTNGFNNTSIGTFSLYSNITGFNNTAIGENSFYYGEDYNNSTALGFNTSITASNQVCLGSSNVTSIGGIVGWSSLSDRRFKKEIKEGVPGLTFIMKLHPVIYQIDLEEIAKAFKTPDSLRQIQFEKEKEKLIQTGFIAQEVEQAANELNFDFSGIDKPKNKNDFYGLRYAEFVVPLVKAVQEQQQIILEQTKEIGKGKIANTELSDKIQSLELRLIALENKIKN